MIDIDRQPVRFLLDVAAVLFGIIVVLGVLTLIIVGAVLIGYVLMWMVTWILAPILSWLPWPGS